MAEEDFGVPWYYWAIFGVVVLLIIGKLNRSSASHPVNAIKTTGTTPANTATGPNLGASTGGDCLKNGCAVVSGVCEKISCFNTCLGCWVPTECGKLAKLGYKYFSSKIGTTMLPGTAGTYFTSAQLSGNPWGLTANSKISNGQYSQLKAGILGLTKNTPANYWCKNVFTADNAQAIMPHICVGPAPIAITNRGSLNCAPNRPKAPIVARVL